MTSRLRIDELVNRLGTGPIAAPEGIALPNANKSGSGTLDWYEEVDWVPVLTCVTPGTLAVTYNVQKGKATRVGRLVTVNFNIQINTLTLGTATGELRISGLPYTSLNDPDLYHYGTAYPISIDLTGTPATFISAVPPNANYIYFRGPQNAPSGTLVPLIGGVTSGDQILGTISYLAG